MAKVTRKPDQKSIFWAADDHKIEPFDSKAILEHLKPDIWIAL